MWRWRAWRGRSASVRDIIAVRCEQLRFQSHTSLRRSPPSTVLYKPDKGDSTVLYTGLSSRASTSSCGDVAAAPAFVHDNGAVEASLLNCRLVERDARSCLVARGVKPRPRRPTASDEDAPCRHTSGVFLLQIAGTHDHGQGPTGPSMTRSGCSRKKPDSHDAAIRIRMKKPNCDVNAVPPIAMNAPMIAVDAAAAVRAGAILRVLRNTRPSGVGASRDLFHRRLIRRVFR